MNYKDIGEVRYVRSNRAKHITIRISQDGDVQVTVPRSVSRRRAEAFVASKRMWINSRLSEIGLTEGRWRSIKKGDILHVCDREIPVLPVNDKESVEDAVWRLLLTEAKEYLPGRVEALALAHGFHYRVVKIRRMKTRWGSCSSGGSINLNSWLMMLPSHLVDYVIMHELVHTRYRNHGQKFWETLEHLTYGKSKKLRSELKGQRIMKIETMKNNSGIDQSEEYEQRLDLVDPE